MKRLRDKLELNKGSEVLKNQEGLIYPKENRISPRPPFASTP
jgi:hypothetical protein